MKKTINLKTIIIASIITLAALFAVFNMKTEEKTNTLEVSLFYTPTCPYCKVAMKFLDRVKPQYPTVTFTYHNAATLEGAKEYQKHQTRLNIPSNGVPLAVFGDKYELGYGEQSGKVYTQLIDEMISKTKVEK